MRRRGSQTSKIWSEGVRHHIFIMLRLLPCNMLRRLSTAIANIAFSRLNAQGHPIGLKLLDLLLYREPPRSQLRPLTILQLLNFFTTTLWKHLFSRPADALEKSNDSADQYMIIDNDPLVNQYISVPKEMSQLNCAAFVAGIIEGAADGAGFPARVTAHTVGGQGTKEGELWPGRTVFVVKFQPEVVEREGFLQGK